MRNPTLFVASLAVSTIFAIDCGILPAANAAGTTDAKIEQLEHKIDVLTEELRKLKEERTIPEKREYKTTYGLGPAASKVYQLDRGVSLGGYGEFNFKDVVSDDDGENDVFDFVRLVAYLGYKFNDWIVFNSELEFEHASTEQDGEVSVEFAQLDFLFDERINARAGLLLLPIGFLNEVHEPPFYHGNRRPPVEDQIIPSTWRANGAGLFGELGPVTYRTYVVSSLDASGFEAESGIREGRQDGSEEIAEDFSWVGRLDYEPVQGASIGGSAYLGDSGQGQDIGTSTPDVFTQLYEAHAEYKRYGVELRILGAFIDIEDADVLSAAAGETIAETSIGYYAEIAYDFLPLIDPNTSHYLAPWFRYSSVDTQDDVPSGFARNENLDREFFDVGLDYKPISQVVLKLDYRNQDAEEGEQPDEIRLGAGFIF